MSATRGGPPLHIVGAGGVGREALDVASALGLPVAGFLDDGRAGDTVRGLPVTPPHEAVAGGYLVAIADPRARLRLAHLLDGRGLAAVTLRHPTSVVAADARIGRGCLIHAHVTISCGTTLGDHVQVHYNSSVGHDTELAEAATVLPGARVAGNVRVGPGATVGSGAVVLQGLSIGRGATVGAGAVVTRDAAPGVVVVGTPARVLRRT